MADLIDLDYLLAALNQKEADLEDSELENFENAIAAASTAIRNFTDHKFETSSGLSETRQYQYDGTGVLEIDDAQSVTAITLDFGNSVIRTLQAIDYDVQPFDGEIYEWIALAEGGWYSGSPEMGFTYNLDRYPYRIPVKPVVATVTGIWGWPKIPADVKRAAVWTTLAFTEQPQPYIAEAIEGYSRSTGRLPSEAGIPARAQSLLVPYVKQKV